MSIEISTGYEYNRQRSAYPSADIRRVYEVYVFGLLNSVRCVYGSMQMFYKRSSTFIKRNRFVVLPVRVLYCFLPFRFITIGVTNSKFKSNRGRLRLSGNFSWLKTFRSDTNEFRTYSTCGWQFFRIVEMHFVSWLC